MRNPPTDLSGTFERIWTSLPTDPYDGQVIDYLADDANGVVWRLRYRRDSASPYKWEPTGAPTPLTAEVLTLETTASATYVDLTTVGPSVVVPLAGDYLVGFGAIEFNNTVNGQTWLAPKLGAATAIDGDGVTLTSATVSAQSNVWRSIRRPGLAAAATIKLQARATIGTSSYLNRNLEVRPLRVG